MSRRDQGLAVQAAQFVNGIEPYTAEVRTRLRGLPYLLHRSGLAATLAYISSKSGAGEGLPGAYSKVEALLKERIKHSEVRGASSFDSLRDPDSVAWLQKLSPAEYARLTEAVADIVLWVKRLSEARHAAEKPGGGPRVTDG
ncbi:type III-B CRISPR module-associated protein Cmr5 [Microbacterium sp.]|uniref:type III-B CRISPR module-associated protein Cmr5 n=1 Tax=Microbacterium sp. TaxID=51671 RepID=UPI0039E3E3B5